MGIRRRARTDNRPIEITATTTGQRPAKSDPDQPHLTLLPPHFCVLVRGRVGRSPSASASPSIDRHTVRRARLSSVSACSEKALCFCDFDDGSQCGLIPSSSLLLAQSRGFQFDGCVLTDQRPRCHTQLWPALSAQSTIGLFCHTRPAARVR